MRPWDRIARAIALWFGCGLVPRAPGTAGTLGAIPLYLLVRPHGPGALLATAIALTIVGIWAASREASRTGLHDPQTVVIDEVAGVHVAWLGAAPNLRGLLVGLLLFRAFDHLKPWPARWAERRLPGGFGIVLDDVIAGVWAAASGAMLARWL